MGIAQPPLNPRETQPWKSLDGLLAISKFENVAVKMYGAPVLSDEPFPFPSRTYGRASSARLISSRN